MKFEHAVFYSAILERLLESYKSYVFNEVEKDDLSKIDYLIQKSSGGKEKAYLLQSKKHKIKEYKKIQERIEKYNHEVNNNILKNSKDLDSFFDEVQDFFNEFIVLIFENIKGSSKQNPKNFMVALLEESKEGNLFLNKKQWKIHYKEEK
jgi:hypothetical protein